MNEIPRRNRQEVMTPAELAIQEAMAAVEKLPADGRLTDAVTLLADAKNMVADYVDGVKAKITLEDLLKTKVALKTAVGGEHVFITPDFRVSVQHDVVTARGVHFIIHPHRHDGETLDFLVVGNELQQI